MSKLTTLANMLDMRHKMPEESFRLLYLRDVWGMEQRELAEYMGRSQPYVSVNLKKIRALRGAIPIEVEWTKEELQLIQFSPRELFTDNQVAAFIGDLLHLEVSHPFFNHNTFMESVRITALASLGVRQTRIVELMSKKQSTVSVIIKSSNGKEFDRHGRYDATANYTFKPKVEAPKNKFILSGGNTFVW